MLSVLRVVVLVGMVSAWVQAMDSASDETLPGDDAPWTEILSVPKVLPLVEGDWQPRVIGGGYQEFSSEQTILFSGVAIEKRLRTDWTVAWELVGYDVDSHVVGSRDSTGLGLNLLFRHDSRLLGGLREQGLTPFWELGAGMAYFDKRTPNSTVFGDGTHFNFDYFFGLGVRTPVGTQGGEFQIGARYFHLSNANKNGDNRNPSIDAVGGFVGISWPF